MPIEGWKEDTGKREEAHQLASPIGIPFLSLLQPWVALDTGLLRLCGARLQDIFDCWFHFLPITADAQHATHDLQRI